jgi:hypothetical protein
MNMDSLNSPHIFSRMLTIHELISILTHFLAGLSLWFVLFAGFDSPLETFAYLSIKLRH